ncbi:MAG: hypothetical protein GDA36_04370 [Rhodobacteraceae bacterium]|nr:hypothetical protein [Paracoccaceae bacterium]
MFGGSFDLATLSGPLAFSLALQRAKRFWWSGFTRLPVFAGQVLPDCHQR